MVITDKAVSKVKEMAYEQGLKGHGLRLMVVGGGCSGFTYDMDLENQENDGDSVTERSGLKIYVDPMSRLYLDGTTIDYIESFKHSGFHFENPNATRTCGCGSSFTV
tara:strand:- start:66274 stop:66594 length:321 start_codon:yes stop_codon:yes gene_type:complete